MANLKDIGVPPSTNGETASPSPNGPNQASVTVKKDHVTFTMSHGIALISNHFDGAPKLSACHHPLLNCDTVKFGGSFLCA